MTETELTPRYCNMCLDEAIAATDGGTVDQVELTEVTRTTKSCVRCGHAYCLDHASPVDQENQCLSCLPLEAIQIEVKPLKTDDGVTHRGKQLIPTGPGYRTLPKAVSEMSDEELTKFISDTAATIHATEMIQDYRRIAISTAKLEQADREDAKARQTRAFQASLPRSARVAITGKKGNGVAKSTVTNFADFIAFAKRELAKKRAGAAPSASSPNAVKGPAKAEAPATPEEKHLMDLLGEKE